MAITKERFLADLNGTSEQITTFTVDENDCWIWSGGLNAGGYAEVYDQASRKTLYAHRVACEHDGGPIPPGRQHHTHHVCGTKNCVNPEHLIVVPAAYHNALIGSVVKATRTHCKSGNHLWTPENIAVKGEGEIRYCRPCRRAYERKLYRRKNARRKASTSKRPPSVNRQLGRAA